MEKKRCPWSEKSPLLQDYHDAFWGEVVTDDELLFKALTLEVFQAGLSFEIVLKKASELEKAFCQWQLKKISQLTLDDLANFLENPNVIRHEGKWQATVNNAQGFLALQKEYGSFYHYLKEFTKGKSVVHFPKTLADIPSENHLSQNLSKDLKKRGFSFVGPKTCYSFLQSVGIINDHLITCFKKDLQIKTPTSITKKHWALFLEAEPVRSLVTSYLPTSKVYELTFQGKLAGSMIIETQAAHQVEIKNFAITPELQNKGFGEYFLKEILELLKKQDIKKVIIATGSVSMAPLYLYQKVGFRIKKIVPDYFTKHYPEPLYEGNVLLKDQVVLELEL